MDLNVARSEQVQATNIRTAADLEHEIPAAIQDLDIEPVVSAATIFSIHESAGVCNRDRRTSESHFAGPNPVNDVNGDLR